MRSLQGHRPSGRQVRTVLSLVLSQETDFGVRMSQNYPSARFYKVDVDEIPEVAQELSIRAMPTFVLFKDGQEVATVVGANPSALEAAIKQHV